MFNALLPLVIYILEPEEGEFMIVSSDQKKWHFLGVNEKERNEWIEAIQDEIGRSIQDLQSRRPLSARTTSFGNKSEVQSIRGVAGNDQCADCGAESKKEI